MEVRLNLKSRLVEEQVKKRLAIWIGLVTLICALAIPAVRSHAAARAANAASPAPAEHPEYRAAINELREARKHLEKADADGYGHRDEAMRAIDHALGECEEAIHALH